MPPDQHQDAEPLRFTITLDQLRELINLAGALYAEARRCRRARRLTAALILLGGSAEAALLAAACIFEPELRAADIWPKGDPTRWTLGQLGNMARKAVWLPTQPPADADEPADGPRASDETDDDVFAYLSGQAGDALRFVERLRNMIVHPGAYVREPLRPDTGNAKRLRETYKLMDGILAHIFDHLTMQMQTLPG